MATIDLRRLDSNRVGSATVTNGTEITWGEILTAFGSGNTLDRVLRDLYDQGLVKFTFADGTVAQDVGGNAYRTLSLSSYSIAQKGKVVSGIGVEGSSGTDTIYGTDKAETIRAGGGADVVTGGGGKDTFAYKAASDSANAAGKFDTITDFKAGEGDRIDLSALGQIAWGGQQSLGAGKASAWYTVSGSTASLFVDTNGDGTADMRIELRGVTSIAQTDLIGVSMPTTPPAPPPAANATADTASITEDARSALVSGNVLSNDASGLTLTSVNGQKPSGLLRVASVKGEHGTLTMGQDGKWVYTLDNRDADVQALGVNETLTETFTYVATGRNGATATSTLTVTIKGSNDGPVAAKDSITTPEDAPVLIDVLANDSDRDGDALVVSSAKVTGGKGSVSLVDGKVKYDPAGAYDSLKPGQTAKVTITYEVSDGNGGRTTSTATVTVTGKDNTNPTTSDPGQLPTSPGTPQVDTITYTGSAPVGGAGQPYVLQEGFENFQATGSGTVNIKGNALNNVIGLGTGAQDTVDLSSGGSDTVTGTAAELNGASITGFGADDRVVVEGASTVRVVNVTAGSAVLHLDTNGDGVADAMVRLEGDGLDGSKLNPNDFAVSSGSGGSTITFAPTNDAPVAVDDTATVAEEGTVLIDVLANDTDTDGPSKGIASASVDPSQGTVRIVDGKVEFTAAKDFNGTATITYTVSDGSLTDEAKAVVAVTAVNDLPVAADDAFSTDEDSPLTIQAAELLGNDGAGGNDAGQTLSVAEVGTPKNGTARINLDGTITYTPNPDFHGTDTFTYTVTDGQGSGSAATATITVTVAPGNDAPTAEPVTAKGNEDAPITGKVTGLDGDGDTLSYRLATDGGPRNGAVTVEADGSFSYRGNKDFHGEDSFTVEVSDGKGHSVTTLVTVTVDSANDAPVAADDAAEVAEGGSIVIDVLANDTDVDGPALTLRDPSVPAGQGTVEIVDGKIKFTAAKGFNGTATITYTVGDGDLADEAQVLVTVTPVDDAPVAQDSSASGEEDAVIRGSVTATDADTASDDLTYSLVQGPAADQGTLDLKTDGTYTFTPAKDFNGTVTFTYKVNDRTTDSGPATVTLTVTPLNDGPDASPVSVGGTEDEAITGKVTATDPEGDALTYALADDAGPSNGTVTVNADGTFSYRGNENFSGTDSFTVVVSDGKGGTATAQVNVTVAAADDVPVARDDAFTTDEDATLTVTAADLIANDTDGDGDALSVTGVGQAGNGMVALVNGQITYTPSKDFSGVDAFTYTVRDAQGNETTAAVTVTVSPSNDAPVAVDGSATEDEGTPITGSVKATDAESDELTYSVVEPPEESQGTLAFNPDGTYVFTPAASFSGEARFTYRANDGTEDSNVATVTLTVKAVDDAPVAVADEASTNAGEAVIIEVLTNDTDADGGPKAVETFTQGEGGVVTKDADGNLLYTPNEGFSGPDTFTYTLNGGSVGTVSVNVKPIVVEPEPPTVTIGDASASESAGSIDIPVTLTHAYMSDVTLTYEMSAPGKVINFDGLPSSGSLPESLPANYEGVRWDGILNNNDGTAIVAVAGGEFRSLDPNGFSVSGLTLSSSFANQMTGGQTVTIQAIKNGAVVGSQTVTLGNGNPTTVPLTFGPDFSGIDAVRIDGAEGTSSGSSYDAPVLIDNVTLAGGTPTTGTVKIPAGQTTGTISIPVANDSTYEVGETITVKLTGAENAALGDDVEGVGTITNDDAQPLTQVFIVNAVEGRVEEGGLGVWFELHRDDSRIDEELTVQFESAVFGNFEVTFPAGVNRIENIELSLADDEVDSGTRPYEIKIKDSPNYVPSGKTSLTGTAVDNDGNSPPVAYDLSFVTDEDTVATEGFLIPPSGYDNQQFNLTYDVVEQPEQGTVTFDAANGWFVFTPHEGVFEHLNDGDKDTVSFKYVASDGAGGISDPATVKIEVGGVSDDYVAPTISMADVTVTDAPTEEGYVFATVKITLSEPSSRDVAVSYDMTGGTAVAFEDYTPAMGTVYIPAGQTEVEIAIPIYQDTDVEANETIEIVLSNPVNATIPEGTGKATVTIIDGGQGGGGNPDAPGIVVTQTDGSTAVVEPGVNGGGVNDTFMISLATAPTANVTVMVMGDYWQVTPNPADPYSDLYLTFTPENWNVPQEVTVTALGDSDEEEGSGAIYVSTMESDDPNYSYLSAYVPVTVTEAGGGSGEPGNTPPSALDGVTDMYDVDAGVDVLVNGYDDQDGSNITYEVVTQPAEGTVTVLPDGKFHFEANTALLESLSRGETKAVTFQYKVTDTGGLSSTAKVTINVHGTNPGDETIHAYTRTTPSQTDFFPLDGKDGKDTVVFNDVTLTSGTGLEISLGKAIKWTEYHGKELVNIENIVINGTNGNSLRTMTVGGDGQVNVITIEDTSHKLFVDGRGGNDTINFKGGTGNGQNTEINVADGNDTVNVSGGASVRITNFTSGDKINFADGIQAGNVTSAVQGGNTVFTINQGGVTSTVTVVGATALVAGTDWTAGGGVVVEPTAPTMSIGDVTVNDTDGTATFVVRLSSAAASEISVDFSTSLGTAPDGALTPQSGTIIFAAGETEKTISVPINDGALSTGSVATFNVELTNATGGVTVADAQAEGTIVAVEPDTPDPSLPTISVTDVSITEGGNLNFRFPMSTASTERLTVTYEIVYGTATADDVDFAQTGTFIIAAGQANRGLNVATIQDALPEGVEAFTFRILSVTTASGAPGATIVDGEGTGTINDDGDLPTEPQTLTIATTTALTEDSTISWNPIIGAVGYTIYGYEPDEPDAPPHLLGYAAAPNTSFDINGDDEFVGMALYVVANGPGGTEIVRSENETALIENINDIATGRPVLSDNTPEFGRLLTISIGDLVDGDGMRTDRPDEFGYIWERSLDGVTWTSAGTGDSYQVTAADRGYFIRGAAQYEDRGGTLETVWSLPTAKVGDANPQTPPVAFDDTATTTPGTAVTIDVLLNDFDFENDPITIASTGQGANGSVAIHNGQLVYTPNANFVGTDTFEYTLNGGDTGRVTVTVQGSNATPLTIATVGNLTENSTLRWNAIPGAVTYEMWGYEPDDPTAPPHLLGFVAAPATSYNIAGNDEFVGMAIWIEANDVNGNMIAKSVNETPMIENINDVPTGNLSVDDMTPAVGQTLTLDIGTFNDGDGYRIRAGHEEEWEWSWQRSSDGVNWTDITTGQTYTVRQADDGYYLRGRAIYEDRSGDTIETVYSLVTSRVGGEPDNSKPVAEPLTVDVDESEFVSVIITPKATDADNDQLTYEIAQQPTFGTVTANGDGTFRFEISREELGNIPEGEVVPITFTYVASDGDADSDPVTVTVNVRGLGSVIVAESITFPEETGITEDAPYGEIDVFAFDAENPDFNDYTFELVTGPEKGTLTYDGSLKRFTFDPNGEFEHLNDGQTDEVTFTYVARNGDKVSAPATVTIVINGVTDAAEPENTKPTADGQSGLEMSEDDATFVVDPSGSDEETSADQLTYKLFSPQPSTGRVEYNPATKQFVFTPNVGAFDDLDTGETATVSFQYVANDGELDSSPATVTITVNGVTDVVEPENTAPTVAAVLGYEIAEDVPDYIDAFGEDADNDPLTYRVETQPGKGVVTVDGDRFLFDPNGEFEYLNDGETEEVTFTYVANDGKADSNVGQIKFVVVGKSDGGPAGPDPEPQPAADSNNRDGGHPQGSDARSLQSEIINDGLNLGSTIQAFGGDDEVYGRDGNDSLVGGNGSDTLYGGSGDDTLNGDGGPAQPINGGVPGADMLYGGDGSDTINGQEGNDTLVGGHGADNLTGGLGDDSFVFLDIFDRGDTVTMQAVAQGNDVLDFRNFDFDPNAAGRQGAVNGFQLVMQAPVAGQMAEDTFYYDATTGRLSLNTGKDGLEDFFVTLRQGATAAFRLTSDDLLV